MTTGPRVMLSEGPDVVDVVVVGAAEFDAEVGAAELGAVVGAAELGAVVGA
jgi:hypothetical protein